MSGLVMVWWVEGVTGGAVLPGFMDTMRCARRNMVMRVSGRVPRWAVMVLVFLRVVAVLAVAPPMAMAGIGGGRREHCSEAGAEQYVHPRLLGGVPGARGGIALELQAFPGPGGSRRQDQPRPRDMP
jgi:hypothetical protein